MTMNFDAVSRSDLIEAGMSPREITRAVRDGDLVRARRDRYLVRETPLPVIRAVRVGGRVTCLSLLALMGIFVRVNNSLHVHMSRGSSRMRRPGSRKSRLAHRTKRKYVKLHWAPLATAVAQAATVVNVRDALAHAVQCQTARDAVATLDSAINQGFVQLADVVEIISSLPARYAVLAALVDERAQSGPETLVRLMARGLGCDVELQARFEGVGYVDLVLDGWLVIECDSERFHSSWEQQKKDRERDVALAALGYTTLRLTAELIMYRPEEALAALRGLLASHHDDGR